MPSFDVVSEIEQQELTNAIDQANREISTRFDFKGTDSKIDLNEWVLTIVSKSEFQIKQINDILKNKLNKSLSTGFASFITTHEPLINKMSTDDLDNLFGKIEEFTKNNKFKPKKTTLAEIGRSCENHTNIVIHSVNKKSNYYF